MVRMDVDCAKSYLRFNPVERTIVNPKTDERVDCKSFFTGGNLRALFRTRPDMVKYRQDDGIVAGSNWISGEQLVAKGLIPGDLPYPLSIHPTAFDGLDSQKKNDKNSKKTKKERRLIDPVLDEHCKTVKRDQTRKIRENANDVPSFKASDQDSDIMEAMYNALYKAVTENPETFIGAYWFTCQRSMNSFGEMIARWQEEKRFMKKWPCGNAPLLDEITRDPFKARDMSEPGDIGSKPVTISCVGLWPCVTASEAQHYEKAGVQLTKALEEANPGSILNLNQDNGGTGNCKDDAPAFGLSVVHNLSEILRTSGGFNTACSSENLLGWKKTCDEYEEGLYSEVHPRNESKPSSSSSSRKHASGQKTMSGGKLQDTKYYSARNYSSAGVKRSKKVQKVSPKEDSDSCSAKPASKKRKVILSESDDE